MAIRTLILVGLTMLAQLSSSPARACSCASTTLAQAARNTPVIVVGTAAAATPDDGANRSVIVVEEGLKGAAAGDRLTVRWRTPNNASCDTVRLTPGRWLLFLTPGEDGLHHIGRCDQHTRRLKDGGRGRIDAVNRELAVKTADAAIAAAVPVVNAALLKAWANAPVEQRELGGPHPGPWVGAEGALVTGDATAGWQVRFSRLPPAGFSHEATATVSPAGRVVVVSATVAFSPD
jgi:hypothetical protein